MKFQSSTSIEFNWIQFLVDRNPRFHKTDFDYTKEEAKSGIIFVRDEISKKKFTSIHLEGGSSYRIGVF
jgi:hypothetical protein